jgi:hypothetical protein
VIPCNALNLEFASFETRCMYDIQGVLEIHLKKKSVVGDDE